MGFARYAKPGEVAKTNSDGTRADAALSPHDDIRLPGGVDSRSLTGGRLYSALEAAGVEGVSPYAPRSQNLDCLARHVDGIKQAAADQAVAAWLASKASAVQVYAPTVDQTANAATDQRLDSLPLPRGQSVKDLTGSQIHYAPF
jgi:hypothetical protein